MERRKKRYPKDRLIQRSGIKGKEWNFIQETEAEDEVLKDLIKQ